MDALYTFHEVRYGVHNRSFGRLNCANRSNWRRRHMTTSAANAPWRPRAGLFLVDHQHDGESSRQLDDAVPAEPEAPPRRLREPADFTRAREPRRVVTEARPLAGHGAPIAAPSDTLAVNTRTAAIGAVGPDSAGYRLRDPGLTEFDAINLSSLLSHQIAPSTLATYRSQWRSFAAWAHSKNLRALPADPVQVAGVPRRADRKHEVTGPQRFGWLRPPCLRAQGCPTR